MESDTFQFRVRGDLVTFTVIERKLPEAYEAAGDRRTALYMRQNKVVAMVAAMRPRGRRSYTFYEVAGENGQISHYKAEKLS